MNGVRHMRLIVRLAFFCAACALLWPIASWTDGMKWVAEASPFVAICSSIALRHVTLGAVAGFAVAVIVMVRRRWFCRYVCPAGIVFEGVSRIGFKKTSWWAKVPVIGRYAALLTFSALLWDIRFCCGWTRSHSSAASFQSGQRLLRALERASSSC